MNAELENVKTRCRNELESLKRQMPSNYDARVKKERRIQSLETHLVGCEIYEKLERSSWVTDLKSIGTVNSTNLTPGGMPEVWVDWLEETGSLRLLPELPERLHILDPGWHLGFKLGLNVTFQSKTTKIVSFAWDDGVICILESESGSLLRVKLTDITSVDSAIAPPAIDPESLRGEIAIVPDDYLTEEEENRRHLLELTAVCSFFIQGKAFAEIRDRRLYRSTHSSFDSYCREVLGNSRNAIERCIRSAEVYGDLLKAHALSLDLDDFLGAMAAGEPDPLRSLKESGVVLPTAASQLRSLWDFQPQTRVDIWTESSVVAKGVPTGALVSRIAKKYRKNENPPSRTENYRVGDVFQLMGLEDEQKKYNDCYCIVTTVLEYSLMVDAAAAHSLQVHPQNLRSLDSEDIERIRQNILRIRSLMQLVGRDENIYPFLLSLSRSLTYTEIDETVLSSLERLFENHPQAIASLNN